jgi:hypothetical protein
MTASHRCPTVHAPRKRAVVSIISAFTVNVAYLSFASLHQEGMSAQRKGCERDFLCWLCPSAADRWRLFTSY